MGCLAEIKKDERGDAVVEATILFPVMIMIFAALVLLAVYLPARGALQRATQHAATAIATEISDTWLFFDEGTMSYYWENNKKNLDNVYVAFFSGTGDIQAKGEAIVAEMEGRSISSKAGELLVYCHVADSIVYKEVVVTAGRVFEIAPLDFSLLGFPQTIPITVTSTAFVQNGDEFVRNMDIAADFAKFISEKFELANISEAISSFGNTTKSLLGW